MKTGLLPCFQYLTLLILATSCDRPECKSANSTFNKFTPDTEEYKIELERQMQRVGAESLSYRFEHYFTRGDKEFIVIHIQGDELCAIGEIQVNDWGKISGMRRQPSGYRGAELQGLKLEIKKGSTGTEFIYKDVERILD